MNKKRLFMLLVVFGTLLFMLIVGFYRTEFVDWIGSKKLENMSLESWGGLQDFVNSTTFKFMSKEKRETKITEGVELLQKIYCFDTYDINFDGNITVSLDFSDRYSEFVCLSEYNTKIN